MASRLVFRFFGNVAFSDGSSEPFDAYIVDGVVGHLLGSQNALTNLWQDQTAARHAVIVTGMSAHLHAFTPNSPTIDKTVTDWYLAVEGTVTGDDGSQISFHTQASKQYGAWQVSPSDHVTAVAAAVSTDTVGFYNLFALFGDPTII